MKEHGSPLFSLPWVLRAATDVADGCQLVTVISSNLLDRNLKLNYFTQIKSS